MSERLKKKKKKKEWAKTLLNVLLHAQMLLMEKSALLGYGNSGS